jgi:hypothetical protein
MKSKTSLLLALTLAASGFPAPAAAAALSMPAAFDAARADVTAATPRAEAPLFHVVVDRAYGTTRHLAVLKLSQLGRPFILSASMEEGPEAATPAWNQLVAFRLSGDRVQFVRVNRDGVGPAGSPEGVAAGRTFPDALLASMPVVSNDAAQGVVVFPLGPAFLSDPTYSGWYLQKAVGGRLALSLGDSALESLSVFPRNAEALVRFVYVQHDSGAPQGLEPRVTALMRYGLSELPEAGAYEARRADGRVGYFTQGYADYRPSGAPLRTSPAVENIIRWDLRKKDPAAEVSEVAQPVVFWLDETVPHRYRDAVASGVLAWNAAFEALGLKGAVVVKQVDRDMSAAERAAYHPADARYNVIRWSPASGSAVGMPRFNPLTGQILSATIRITEDFVQGAMDMELLESASGGSVLTAAERDAVNRETLTHTVMHEVGHVLGLRHNFLASARPDASGHASSVMDYSPVFVSTSGTRVAGHYLEGPGKYDRWALEYGYKPLNGDAAQRRRQLAAVAARADADPGLAYAADEHADGADPEVRRFDQGAGLEFAELRAGQARRLWRRLEADPARADEDLEGGFRAGLRAVRRAAGAAASYVGGVRGRDGRRAPVSAAEQRRALAWLSDNVFAAEALAVDPALAARFSKSPRSGEAPPELALDVRRGVLDALYAPATLQRLADAPAISTDPSGVMSIGEMSDTVRRSVWSEAAAARPVVADRRGLQRAHIDVLSRTLRDPKTHDDGRVTARRDLLRIARDADAAAAQASDEDVRAYYFDAALRARRALDERAAASHDA